MFRSDVILFNFHSANVQRSQSLLRAAKSRPVQIVPRECFHIDSIMDDMDRKFLKC